MCPRLPSNHHPQQSLKQSSFSSSSSSGTRDEPFLLSLRMTTIHVLHAFHLWFHPEKHSNLWRSWFNSASSANAVIKNLVSCTIKSVGQLRVKLCVTKVSSKKGFAIKLISKKKRTRAVPPFQLSSLIHLASRDFRSSLSLPLCSFITTLGGCRGGTVSAATTWAAVRALSVIRPPKKSSS